MTSPYSAVLVSSHAELGGSEQMLEQLIDRLEPTADLRVVTLAEGPFADRVRSRRVAVSVIPTGRRAGTATGAVRLRADLSRWPVDVVLASGVKAGMVAALAVGGRSTPLVWLRPDLSWDGPLSNWVARRADAVIAVSPSVSRTLPGAVQTKVRLIWNGFPTPATNCRDVRDLLGIAPTARVLGMTARLTPSKGQMHLVEAAAGIAEIVPDVQVVLIGSDDPAAAGFREALWVRATELGVADRLHTPGYIARASELVRQFDVMAVPSMRNPDSGWEEGFGLSGAEALAVGVPVVGYASGALPEVLGDAAVLVPEGDANALSSAIVEILKDDSKRERLSARGQRRYAERYTIERWSASYQEMLRQLAWSGSR